MGSTPVTAKKRIASGKVNPVLAQILKNDTLGADCPREGSVVEVTLIKKMPRQAFFDLGRFGTGIVCGLEFQNAKEIIDRLKEGERLPAKVTNLEGEGGYAELSLSEADKQRLWQQVKELQEAGEIVKAKIVGANLGGLIATLGNLDLKAFLPASQLSNEHYPKVADSDQQKIAEELKKYIGEEFNVKIIDVNPRNNKLIISEREILNANVKELLGNYTLGQVIDGLVSGIADFGVFVRFVDNPQIEGLIHISELDYQLIDNPKEVVKMNESVKAKIIEIRDGRVFLSLKALKPNPWDTIGDRYAVGQEVVGKVHKFNPFGAIVALDGGIQGVIHVSEFGGLEEMKKELVAGSQYQFIIDSIKPEEKRLTLKLKK